MTEKKAKLSSATARVQLTLDVPADSAWAASCSLDQIYRQAGRETAQGVVNALQKSGIRATVLNMKVTAISAVEEN